MLSQKAVTKANLWCELMQECGKSFTLLINHWAYCCTYFPELLFFQAIWFISVTLQLFHKKKVPETSRFLLLCLCVGAIHIYTHVHGDWLQHPHCSSPSHAVFPSLDNHRPQKRQLHDQKVEILALYSQHHSYSEKECLGPHIHHRSLLNSPRLRQTLTRLISSQLFPHDWSFVSKRFDAPDKQNIAEAQMQSTVYGFKRREEKFILGSVCQIWKCAIYNVYFMAK